MKHQKYIDGTLEEQTVRSKQEPYSAEICLIRFMDGSFACSTDHAEHFIYFYPDTLKELLRFLTRSSNKLKTKDVKL